jgi:hypothetical protein
MIPVLTYAVVVSLILAVVLAVARDVPILHLLVVPDADVNEFLAGGLGFLLLVLVVAGWGPSSPTVAPWCQGAAGAILLAYFWWSVVWHLRERR